MRRAVGKDHSINTHIWEKNNFFLKNNPGGNYTTEIKPLIKLDPLVKLEHGLQWIREKSEGFVSRL